VALWAFTPCNFVHQHFGETCHPDLEVVSFMEMAAAGFSATLVTTYETTFLHNIEDYSLSFRCSENLKSHLEGNFSLNLFS
jgi:hypothetical protein